jgi:hypothetical protein
MLALFGAEPSVRMMRRGHSTRHCRAPARRSSSGTATVTGTRRSAATRDTNPACSGGSASGATPISATVRPRSTPGRPATWSAWKCVSRRYGTRRTPSRLRHRSAARGSGPASTTTPVRSPTASTSMSPCPTSHATMAQPRGGQPSIVHDGGSAGRASSATSTAAAAAESPRRRPITGQPSAAVSRSAASTSAPDAPAGQSTAAPGSRAACSATTTIHHAASPASRPNNTASGGATAAVTVARTPKIVAGATAGATSRLAGTATMLTCAESRTTTGAHITWAAAGIASASASGRGRRFASRSLQDGARTRSPPVARTDSTKPYDLASHGSISTSNPTAAQSAGRPRRPRPDASASSPTRPIAAARSTLGCGRASSTKPSRASPASTTAALIRTPAHRAATRTAPHTIARLAPDTAG